MPASVIPVPNRASGPWARPVRASRDELAPSAGAADGSEGARDVVAPATDGAADDGDEGEAGRPGVPAAGDDLTGDDVTGDDATGEEDPGPGAAAEGDGGETGVGVVAGTTGDGVPEARLCWNHPVFGARSSSPGSVSPLPFRSEMALTR